MGPNMTNVLVEVLLVIGMVDILALKKSRQEVREIFPIIPQLCCGALKGIFCVHFCSQMCEYDDQGE